MKIGDCATRDLVTLTPDDSIDLAIELMERHGFHHLVVARQGGVVGMLSDRDILISTGWMLKVERIVGGPPASRALVAGPVLVREIMARPVICLSQDESCRSAAATMFANKISAIPVTEHERLVGLITDTDLIRWLDAMSCHNSAADRLLRQPVRELMQREVVYVDGETLLSEVVGRLRSHRIRHVPVVADGLVQGMVSDRDVRRALGWSSVRDAQAEAEGRLPQPEPQRAAEVMQSPSVVIGPDFTLRDALRLMLDRKIHALPVVEADRLVGILTQSDLVRAISREELL
jgi:CBS domain-containing protein